MEIKAALPEEFSRETRDANRWLMAMEAYFILHEDNILTQQEPWFFSIECPKDKEKPLLRLGSPSSKTNAH